MSRGRTSSVAVEPDRPGESHWPATCLLVALLAVMAARAMLNEPTFHRSPMTAAGAYAGLPVAEQIYTPLKVLRVATACAILAMAAAWAVVVAIRPNRRTLRHPIFAAGLGLAAIFLLISALRAPDRSEGLVTALEQIALLTAAMVAMQCARASWQRRLVLVVLVALAATLGLRAVYQSYVEIPEQVEDFEQHRPERLATLGHAADSPEAAMFETRLREQTPKGFWSLANVFGSVMVLLSLAAAGPAADKWLGRSGASAPPSDRAPPRRRGEIPLPLLAAILSTMLVVPAVLAWWLTESTGAIGSGIVAAALAIGLCLCRDWVRHHRRALVIAAVIAFIAATVGVVAVGLSRGGLPMRTLQVRWEYWTGSAAMLGERPIWGVGPGNYPDAYLPHRPLGAEEAVKNPHNVIVQALTEYGLAAGSLYLALLVWILIKLAAADRDDPTSSHPPSARVAWLLAACVGAGAIGWRLAAIGYPNLAVAVFDNFIPVLAMVVGLAGAMWVGRVGRTALSETPRFAGYALAAGLAGFALHNLSDFALFKPGAAMVFWVAAGAVAAGKRGRDVRLSRSAAAGVSAVLIAGLIAACAFVLGPIRRADEHVYAAATAYSTGRGDQAVEHLRQAVDADPLDGAAASDAAALLLRKAQYVGDAESTRTLTEAAHYAAIACKRQPQRVAYRQMRLQLAAFELDPELLRLAWADPPADLEAQRERTAAELATSPDDPGLLNAAAQLAYAAEDYDAAVRHLTGAIRSTAGQSPILYDRLGDVYLRMGDAERAGRQWRMYREWTSQIAPVAAERLARDFERVAAMDPHDAYRRLRTAQLAYHVGLPAIARTELAAAETAEAALWPSSVMRFNERTTAEIELLAAKLAGESTAPPGP